MQRVEYVSDPGLTYTIKNISDFSKQHEGIASNEGFYLDTNDTPTMQNCNLQFFNNTGARAGYELFFVVTLLEVTATVATSATTWVAGDSVVPRIRLRDGTYKDVTFRTNAAFASANMLTGVARALTIEANGKLGIDAGADNVFIRAFTSEGIEVILMSNNVQVEFAKNSANAAAPIDGGNTALVNGSTVTGLALIQDAYNKGFEARQRRTELSTVDYVWIPFKNIFQFCRHYRKVSRGLRHRIVLNRNSDSLTLLKHGSQVTDRVFQITNLSAWIPRLQPSLEVLKGLEAQLSSNTVVDVNFTDLTLYRSGQTFTNGSNNALQLATTSKRPIRVYVAFQNAARVNGGQVTNKRVFDNIQLREIEVRLNGRKYPLYAYKFPNPTTTYEGFNRAYAMLMNASYKMKDHDEGSLLDLETFYNLYQIYYFDLTAQNDDLFKSVSYAELEIRWSNVNIDNYYVYCLYESERKLKFQGLNGSLVLQQ